MTDFIKSYDTTVIYGGDEAILEPNVCIAYISRNPFLNIILLNQFRPRDSSSNLSMLDLVSWIYRHRSGRSQSVAAFGKGWKPCHEFDPQHLIEIWWKEMFVDCCVCTKSQVVGPEGFTALANSN